MGGKNKLVEDTKYHKKNILIIILSIITVTLIGTGIFFLRKTPPVVEELPEVGSIDYDKIMSSKTFQTAKDKVKSLTEKFIRDFEVATKNLDESKEEDAKKIQQMREEFQTNLIKQTDAILLPQRKRVEAAVARIALDNNMNTVLDKSIVVCGAKDITDDVLNFLETQKEIKMPSDSELKQMSDRSRIGYFDKEVVLNLRDFRTARAKIQQIEVQLGKKFEEETKNLSEEEKMRAKFLYIQELQRIADDINAPLFRQVNRTVRQIAESRKLDLVINKENVMYGGRNITGEIAQQLTGIKK